MGKQRHHKKYPPRRLCLPIPLRSRRHMPSTGEEPVVPARVSTIPRSVPYASVPEAHPRPTNANPIKKQNPQHSLKPPPLFWRGTQIPEILITSSSDNSQLALVDHPAAFDNPKEHAQEIQDPCYSPPPYRSLSRGDDYIFIDHQEGC